MSSDRADSEGRLRDLVNTCASDGASDAATQTLTLYLEQLLRWNEKMDLVAPAAEAVLIERHFEDSILALSLTLTNLNLPNSPRLLDVGSGAGFPGAVWASLMPDWHIELLEPRRKRAEFLRQLCRTLKLKNCSVIEQRLEAISRGEHGYDIICSRAVAFDRQLLDDSRRLLVSRGTLCLLVGPDPISAETENHQQWDISSHPYPPAGRLSGHRLLTLCPQP